jgi:PcfJ-like protein
MADRRLRRNEAIHLVNRGARLRDVAGVMNIPMALRHIKPGVAHWATEVFCRYPKFLSFMPNTTAHQRIWLLVVNWAINKTDAEFGEWAARHVPEIRGRTVREVGNFLADIVDWARPDKDAGREFITRPFTPSMSLKTVTALSAKWHEAVANSLDGPNSAFPTPWYPAAKLGDYEIIPIEDAASLYREGIAMHHCIGTYAGRVQSRELCIYSVRRNGERVATLALGAHNGRSYLEQIRGTCNTEPAKAIVTPVLRWLRAQPPLGAELKEEAA